jgi:uncharacterized protein YihD (DUF1040 family)
MIEKQYKPSNMEWKVCSQMIKLVRRGTRNNPYTNGLVKNMQKAIKEKDYETYRKNMDEIQIYYAKMSGKTVDEIKKTMHQGKEKLISKFSKQKKQLEEK